MSVATETYVLIILGCAAGILTYVATLGMKIRAKYATCIARKIVLMHLRLASPN